MTTVYSNVKSHQASFSPEYMGVVALATTPIYSGGSLRSGRLFSEVTVKNANIDNIKLRTSRKVSLG